MQLGDNPLLCPPRLNPHRSLLTNKGPTNGYPGFNRTENIEVKCGMEGTDAKMIPRANTITAHMVWIA